MAGGHTHQLYRPLDTAVHRLPPHCKLVAMIAFTLVVVATDRQRFAAFGLYALILGAVALLARLPAAFILRRMVVEVPFVAFAVALPFLSEGERISVLGLPMSVDGLLAAWNILAKATLGVIASILPAATTEPRALLLGPNGAGKTTLVMHLNGILTPGLGTVSVGGLPVRRENLREIRRRVGLVFQDPDDQLFMPTVGEDVAFGPANLGLRGQELNRCVNAALEQVGLLHLIDRPPHHLSFGQRRRVAVATVLATRPEILVLDEPSSNLDPASRRELADILRGLDVTVLMVTHGLPYALELCERSLILSGGTIVADGPSRRILADATLLAQHRLELPYGMAVTGS
ncbi:ATP-binding cassette domain-containing protein [Streptosporangium sp. LJ11]|uniref:ATP-binding cassette domain-containing protein n=1 Tax=Streptosporangium sp. LJ11 TaxID=3436927 RepID=UPI003F7A5BA0